MGEYPDAIERLLSHGPDPGGPGSSDRKPLDTWWAAHPFAFPWRLCRFGVWARVRIPKSRSARTPETGSKPAESGTLKEQRPEEAGTPSASMTARPGQVFPDGPTNPETRDPIPAEESRAEASP